MKFDFVIGNPPYQDETLGDNDTYAPPVYNLFMDSAYEVGDKVELVHPARFLFNAGSTPKAWNDKMLHDEHFKVLEYEEDCTKLFSNTDIKGGIAITYRDAKNVFGAIDIFTPYVELNQIIHKVLSNNFRSLMDYVFIQNRFNLEALYSKHPQFKKNIGSDGKDPRFEKNIFTKIPLFSDEHNSSYILTLGVNDNKRTTKYIPEEYVDFQHENLLKYKVVLTCANGNGEFGQILSGMEILEPREAYTRSFIGIGQCETKEEAFAIKKYLSSKFARALLSVLKVTQMNNKPVWKYVPLQDFSNNSDIDWSKTVSEIDKQLYKKYGLSQEEIEFIETHVKEMA